MSSNDKAPGESGESTASTNASSKGPGPTHKSGNVEWAEGVDPQPWHADSTIPAATHLTGLPLEVPEAVSEPPQKPEEPEESLEVPPPVHAGGADAEGAGGAEADETRRRSKTIARKQMMRERRRMLAQGTLPEILDYERPETREECRKAKRPCLYVSCRYHLYLDVNPVTGSIKINFPDKEVWELRDTCALDVAERGGITLEEVGDIMNLTRERIRQVEVSGLDKLREEDTDLETFLDGHERLPILEE